MARGKHAGKNNTFFGDENYYKRRNNNEESELEEDKEENAQEKSSYNNYSNNDYNYDEGKNFSDYEDEYEDENGINMKKVFIVIFIIAIIIFIVAFLYNKSKKNDNTSLNESSSNTQAMSSQYEGYKVLGQLKIDKIGITQYILDSTDEDALKKGVCKIYGGSLNNYGNFCIVGHNYEDFFAKLSDLVEGDTISIIDKKMQETEYKITKIYSVEPDNLECLTQDDSKVEITLITCKDGSTERLVLKAEKIK